MQFNSIEFILFLPLAYCCYWFLFQKNIKLQNLFVVIISYVFYGWWNWRLLGLIMLTSFLGWCGGILTEKVSHKAGKKLVAANVIVNLSILGVFKYYNFFAENLLILTSSLGIQLNITTLNLLLPVGISFYTFQTLSYVIDVYRGQIRATNDIIAFFAYVCFFPQLVAGPIERATNLLPQFLKPRTFDYAKSVDGMRQILIGMFKKVVIADNCAMMANTIYKISDEANALTLLLGALMFTFQIYGDFSGYSDIAIGTSRLFGFNLMDNFRSPYFSSSIPEFWRRWHISLNTWFRDYVYIPLGGNRKGKGWQIFNTLIVFSLSGLWHGASWTYVIWGLYFALLSVPYILIPKEKLPKKSVITTLLTFCLVVVGWIFFGSESIGQAVNIICSILTLRSGQAWSEIGLSSISFFTTILFIIVMLMLEWRTKEYRHVFCRMPRSSMARWAIYLTVVMVSLVFVGRSETFIYFQF